MNVTYIHTTPNNNNN